MSVKRRSSVKFLSRLIPVIFLAACLVQVHVVPVQAKTYTVTTAPDGDCSDNQCDLPSALAEARINDEDDTLNLQAGTYTATAGTLFSYTFNATETSALTIAGAGSGSTILDGGSAVQVLYIQSQGSVIIRDLTIQNGSSILERGGGLLVSCNGTATIASVVVQDNTGSLDGGGAYVSAALGGSISNSDFLRNFSDEEGGGVRLNVNNGDFTLHNNLFQDNQANLSGGGAYIGANFGNVTVTDNDFVTNDVLSEGFSGGGLWLSLNLGDGNVSRNRFEGNGAAAGASSGAAYGGGAYLVPSSGGTMLFEGNVLSGNATGGGGRGGGLYVTSSFGSLSLFTAINNVFVGNETQDGGSAMYYETSEHTLNFTNNTATLNTGAAAVSIRLSDTMATANIYNNILWGNTGADLSVFDGSSTTEAWVNLYNNDMVNYGVVPAIGTTNKAGGGNITDDPLLVDAPNGDIHLGSGSPAINTGLNSAPGLTTGSVDFEGEDRIQGSSVDMGADETDGGSVPTVPNIVVTDNSGEADDLAMTFNYIVHETGSPAPADSRSAQVMNTGSAALVIGTIESPAAPYSLTDDTCSNQTLGLNESCSFKVLFQAQTSGSYSGTVNVPSNDNDTPIVAISLSGEATTSLYGSSGGSGGCDCSLAGPARSSLPGTFILLAVFALALFAWRRLRT